MMSPKTSTKDGGKGRVLTYGATSRHQQPAAELSSESRGRNALYGNRHSTSLSSTMSLPSSSNPKSIRDELKSPEDATKKRKHHSAFKSTAAPVARATSSSALSSQHSSLHLQNVSEQRKNDAGVGRPALLSSKARKPRLIDTLVAQKKEESASDSDSSSSSNAVHAIESRTVRSDIQQHHRTTQSRPIERRTTITKGKKVKMTYSMSRTTSSQATPDLRPSDREESCEHNDKADVDPFAMPEEIPDVAEDDSNNKVGIRSVHELRRAGANNRFSDELDDLLSRIGLPSATPSSMRRNALCELSHKLQQNYFSQQFRDHSARDKLVEGIGSETDVICGYAFIATVITFLAAGPAPNLFQQLAHEHVGRLLSRLMIVTEKIAAIAAQRSSNVSRHTRVSLEKINSILADLAIWHGYELSDISPQTLSLHLLDTLVHFSEPEDAVQIMSDVQSNFSSVVTQCSSQHDCIDRYLVISILEARSNLSAPRDPAVSTAAAAFLNSLFFAESLETRPTLTNLILKLSINMTNDTGTSAAFSKRNIIDGLSLSIARSFEDNQSAVSNKQLSSQKYDQLLLLLGVFINLLEHCLLTRESISSASLEKLSSVWAANVSSLNEADSVGQSKLSVAFGYLAIIVGYLYTVVSNRLQMRSYNKWPGTSQLISAVQDFVGIYRSTNGKVDELELLVQDLRRMRSSEVD